jgi:uncharacterized protein (TIGR02145 family)
MLLNNKLTLLLIFSGFFILTTCKKVEKVMMVTTGTISDADFNSVKISGQIIDLGEGATQYGHYYSKIPNETNYGIKTQLGTPSKTGTFTSQLTGLAAGTNYYIKAYISDRTKTVYGKEIIFSTVQQLADIDGNIYQIVSIGTQVWMKENLKVTKYRNGNIIGTTFPASLNILNETAPKYQWAYFGDESIVATYGRLYTWYAITDSRGICPTGWHVPSDNEWTTLTNYLGSESTAGGRLKETGYIHWVTPNTGATNESGFTALPGGYRTANGNFVYIDYCAIWWSATEYNILNGWYRYLDNTSTIVYINGSNKSDGYSVRCIKD